MRPLDATAATERKWACGRCGSTDRDTCNARLAGRKKCPHNTRFQEERYARTKIREQQPRMIR